MLVNTSRGEIVELPALIEALESKKLWGVALDVFEGEKKYIFHDKSKDGFKEHPDLAKLSQFEHVILSSHIAFYTDQVIRETNFKYYSLEDFSHSGSVEFSRIFNCIAFLPKTAKNCLSLGSEKKMPTDHSCLVNPEFFSLRPKKNNY